MADIRSNLAGIKSPNPFWLASAPPTNSGYQIMKAFDADGEVLSGKRWEFLLSMCPVGMAP